MGRGQGNCRGLPAAAAVAATAAAAATHVAHTHPAATATSTAFGFRRLGLNAFLPLARAKGMANRRGMGQVSALSALSAL